MTEILHSAVGKVVFILLLLYLWSTFAAAEATNLLYAFQWFLSQSAYPVFTKSTFNFFLDVLYLISTYKILLWIFAPNSHDTDQGVTKGSSKNNGFTSRSIYQ